MFSRPRADDEERDAEDSCKKGGRLLQLLPLHQELLLFVTFGFPQVASHFLLAWTSNFSAPCWHKIVSLSLLAINLICCSPSSYFSYCSLFFFPPPFFTCLSWPWIVHRRTSRIAHTYIWWKQSLPFHSLPLLAVFVTCLCYEYRSSVAAATTSVQAGFEVLTQVYTLSDESSYCKQQIPSWIRQKKRFVVARIAHNTLLLAPKMFLEDRWRHPH